MIKEETISTWGDSQVLNNEIIINSSIKKKYLTLAERFADYTGSYQPPELDTGIPVGSEEF